MTGFEEQSGCEVRVKTANTSDEMVALMNEGGFDLVTASGDASLRLIAGKRVQEVNTALIPSWSKVRACRTRPGMPSTASTMACPISRTRTC